jgi:hypothetical protein
MSGPPFAFEQIFKHFLKHFLSVKYIIFLESKVFDYCFCKGFWLLLFRFQIFKFEFLKNKWKTILGLTFSLVACDSPPPPPPPPINLLLSQIFKLFKTFLLVESHLKWKKSEGTTVPLVPLVACGAKFFKVSKACFYQLKVMFPF